MKLLWALLIAIFALAGDGAAAPSEAAPVRKAYVIPVRDDIMSPMVYLVRRGVKEAMESKADLLIIDMDTNGGRVDATEEILQILNQYPGRTVTYVNKKAFSAGAFIAVATQRIYMAPQSVIGAAAPIMLAPGSGPAEMPNTMEVKMTSALRALVRTCAEKNGHNVAVVEAMIDKSRELKIDGEVLNEKGQILTLTDVQAARTYGDPPKPLLSLGTVDTLDALLKQLAPQATVHRVEPTGAEQLGSWLYAISPILLIIGVVGLYIEFKTPGFGVPGIVGIAAFLLYFLGGYVSGLSGWEWVLVFLLGLVLVIVDLFLFPGTVVIGVIGGIFMLAALLLAMADLYSATPTLPGMPSIPAFQLSALERPFEIFIIAAVGSIASILILRRFLPQTALYHALVSQGVSGGRTEAAYEAARKQLLGQVGITISPLRPGGKAQFDEDIVDVVTQGDMIPSGARVKVIDFSGAVPIVERAD